MVSILENPAVRHQARPIDLRTYHWMVDNGLVEENAELLRGVAVKKMSKSPLHEYVRSRLFELAQAAAGADHSVRKEGSLTLTDSEPEPDIAIVSGKSSDFRQSHPTSALLVIEVAISSLEVDRKKARIYAEAGVLEYWLVIPEKGILEIHSAPAAGIYARQDIVTRGKMAVSETFPNLKINLAELLD